MRLVQILMVLGALSPHSAVYIKGHSRAAESARATFQSLTCFDSGGDLESSAGILQVDHIVGRSGRSWVVMVLTDRRNNVVYEGKAEEYPWPLPSSSSRLLRSLAKSACPDFAGSRQGRPSTAQRTSTERRSPSTAESALQARKD